MFNNKEKIHFLLKIQKKQIIQSHLHVQHKQSDFTVRSFEFWRENNCSFSHKQNPLNRGNITVPLTSCLTGLDQSVLLIKTKIVSCHTAYSKPVKQKWYSDTSPFSIPCLKLQIFFVNIFQKLKTSIQYVQNWQEWLPSKILDGAAWIRNLWKKNYHFIQSLMSNFNKFW